MNTINKTELELAIEYLKKRSVSTKGVKKERVKIMARENTTSEVEWVLTMLQEGTFLTFYEKMKNFDLGIQKDRKNKG